MRLTPRPQDRRPDPAPLATDDRAAVLLGTAVWAVLLVVAVVEHDRLAADGRGWWVWTPVVGIVLGLLGLRTVTRRARARTAPAGRATDAG